MSEQSVQQVEPEETFAALADETRLGILQALWKSDTQAMTFSELRRAVGMRDPGQFNYHLGKLVGQFVTKTDGRYRLTQAGKHVNGAIALGAYTAQEAIDPIVLDHLCRVSDEPLTLRYENWYVPASTALLVNQPITEMGLRSDFRLILKSMTRPTGSFSA